MARQPVTSALTLVLGLLLMATVPAAAQMTPDPADCEQYQFRVSAAANGTDSPEQAVEYGALSAPERDLFDRALASDTAVVVRGEAVETLRGMPRTVVHEGTTYRLSRTGYRCGLPWAPGIGVVRTVGVVVLLAVGILAGRRVLN